MGAEIAPGDLLTTSEVADLLRVSRTTVMRWAKERLLPAVELPPSVDGATRGTRRFRREDVEAFISSSAKEAS